MLYPFQRRWFFPSKGFKDPLITNVSGLEQYKYQKGILIRKFDSLGENQGPDTILLPINSPAFLLSNVDIH